MRAVAALAAVLAARLMLACGAWAQEANTDVRAVPHRLEVGGTVGAIWLTPTIGLLASLPARGRLSVEAGVNLTPHDVFVQAQMRVPFGAGRGARRSVIVGLTHLSRRTSSRGVLQTGLAAHAGMSAQAPLSRRFDLRADLQMVVPIRGRSDADPRGVVSVVWHR